MSSPENSVPPTQPTQTEYILVHRETLRGLVLKVFSTVDPEEGLRLVDRLTDGEAAILDTLQTSEEREHGARQSARDLRGELTWDALHEQNHPGSQAHIRELIKGFGDASGEEKTRKIEGLGRLVKEMHYPNPP